ncbi:LysR family transcriptional regulator [Homoserinibacter sp. YIM 151385]|uniref:LysR family transcriptional regulator n=1 Tax=Homoserinibacter sp. YIM 151385 TaxID=2985506 RepID=UPI0022F11814|nr:LysR family transcriptional regulator [Homoserinibacter sp. YIM 151385]WBU38535.1 LysR family transcriptional regulator [Homoserinibacter sp. YIM 151385]
MQIAQLRAFLAAVDTGTFTAAAARLGVAQPTVSELIRRLESDAGLQFFVRGGRRLVLTAAGRELLPWARRVVDGVDGADETLRAVRGVTAGEASFGVLRNAEHYVLSGLAERFHRAHPGVRVRLVGQNSVEVAHAVRDGGLEAGLVVLPIDDAGLAVTPLLRDEVVWVTSERGRSRRHMTIERIAQRPLILYDAHYGEQDPTRRQLAERAQSAGIRLEPAIEVENAATALDLVARGLGETMVATAVTRSPAFGPELHAVGFAEPLFDVIALVTREHATLSPMTERLVAVATDMLLAAAGRGATVAPTPR